MNNGVIVNYKYCGTWKHVEFIIKEPCGNNLLTNDDILNYILYADNSFELSHDNIACIGIFKNYTGDIKELESLSSSEFNINKIKGCVFCMHIVNDDLYEEWRRP